MNAKRIVYVRHARRSMRFWRISHERVVATLEAPDRVLPMAKGRFNAIKAFEDGFLRVTYKEEDDRILVVTVTPRKRPW
ncbi:MAG: hypothetical protein Q7K03_06130 [Dehalococcoidia bacterium]|nr:hypothetical protein [Dehalococcoidia bacterium]